MKMLSFPLMVGAAIATAGQGIALEPEAVAEPIWYNCLTREVFTPEKQAWCDRWKTLQNATYPVPTSPGPNPDYTTVTLENGGYLRDDDQFVVELVNQPGWIAFGDINTDGKTDAAVIFGVGFEPESREVATYLTAVLDVDGTARPLNPIQLGEQILLGDAISISRDRINVPLLTQTELTERAFVVDGMALSELAPLPGPVDPISEEPGPADPIPSEPEPGDPVFPNPEPLNPVPLEPGPADPILPEGTWLFSQTSNYTVRVFSQNGRPQLNLYNKATGIVELSAVPVEVWSDSEGTVYRHVGEPPVKITIATSGTQTLEINRNVMTDYAQVSGTVTYRPRIALPPNAVVNVTLVDVSRADAPAITLASQAILVGNRQVPIPFTLLYDPEQIDPRFTYAVQARITVDGQLRFINTTRTTVITQGSPTEVEVMVDPVSR